MPVDEHSFDVNKKAWKKKFRRKDLVKTILNCKGALRINRGQLLKHQKYNEEFIVKVLMWGFPTGGRGNNIKQVLKSKSIKKLSEYLISENLEEEWESIVLNKNEKVPGLGISSLSKLLYFSRKRIQDYRCVILDKNVADVINHSKFDEFGNFRVNLYSNRKEEYVRYLEKMDDISKKLELSSPDKLEMFLYCFGNNVSTT